VDGGSREWLRDKGVKMFRLSQIVFNATPCAGERRFALHRGPFLKL